MQQITDSVHAVPAMIGIDHCLNMAVHDHAKCTLAHSRNSKFVRECWFADNDNAFRRAVIGMLAEQRHIFIRPGAQHNAPVFRILLPGTHCQLHGRLFIGANGALGVTFT